MRDSIAGYLITKDRPMQCKALLDSLIKNSGNLLETVCILYKADPPYVAAYERLKLEYSQFLWFNEGFFKNFQTAFLNILRNISQDIKYVIGLTDDTIAYRPLVSPYTLQSFVDLFEQNESLFTIGLRLGKNTIHQNPDDPSDLIKIPSEFKDGFAIWNWTKGKGDHNEWYPISLDGHLYRTQELLDVSSEVQFNNLRTWEGNLISQVRNPNSFWYKEKYGIACPELSYCVNVPLNMIQYPFHKTFGPYGISAAELLRLFNEGYYINLDKTFEHIQVVGSHQYLPMVFTKENL